MKRKVRMIVAVVCTIAVAGLFFKPDYVNVYAKSYGVDQVVVSETVVNSGDLLLVPTAWETNGMHIYFYTAEGDSLKDEDVAKGQNYTIPEYTATMFAPLPDGYEFAGWKVEGKPEEEGGSDWKLQRILTPSGSGESTPEPSIKPTPVVTEEPTDTPTPAVTEEPTDTPTPAVTEEPTDTPTPVVTEEPTDTPTPAVTEKPADTPTPVVTEKPADTPTPVVTEKPADTPTPVVTEEPIPTTAPVVTEKPIPTAPAVTEAPSQTAAPVVTEAPSQTAAPVVTEAPSQTAAPVVTEAPSQTQTPAPAVTEAPAPTQTPAATAEPTITPGPTQTPDQPGEDTDSTVIKSSGAYQLQPLIKYSLQGGVSRVEGDITHYANPIEFTVEAGGMFTFY